MNSKHSFTTQASDHLLENYENKENKENKNQEVDKKRFIIHITLTSLILLGIIILSIEYNIVINKFAGGLSGFGGFINNSTQMINYMNNLIGEINETDTMSYIHKVKLIIDEICSQKMVNCVT